MIEISISQTAFMPVKSDSETHFKTLDEILRYIQNGNEEVQDPFGQIDVFRLFGYFIRDEELVNNTRIVISF